MDLVLVGMMLARGAANFMDQLFGRQSFGWGGVFLAHFQSPRGFNEAKMPC